jgi:hypothetical protein
LEGVEGEVFTYSIFFLPSFLGRENFPRCSPSHKEHEKGIELVNCADGSENFSLQCYPREMGYLCTNAIKLELVILFCHFCKLFQLYDRGFPFISHFFYCVRQSIKVFDSIKIYQIEIVALSRLWVFRDGRLNLKSSLNQIYLIELPPLRYHKQNRMEVILPILMLLIFPFDLMTCFVDSENYSHTFIACCSAKKARRETLSMTFYCCCSFGFVCQINFELLFRSRRQKSWWFQQFENSFSINLEKMSER